MGFTSIWHWVIVLVIVLILFGGRGKISQIMGDVGKGLKSFKNNIKEEPQSSSDMEKNPKITADQSMSMAASQDEEKHKSS